MGKNNRVLYLSIFVGMFGVHRLYLRLWSGISYIPLLFTGITLTASGIVVVKLIGWGCIAFVATEYFLDIYKIRNGQLIEKSDLGNGRLKFIVMGLFFSIVLWLLMGITIIVSGVIPFPRYR